MEQQEVKIERFISPQQTRLQAYYYVEQGEVGRNAKESSVLLNQKKVRVPF